MSKYLLKISGSNEIVNIIEWDGVTPLSFPSMYEITPFSDETIEFIQNPTSSLDAVQNNYGFFDGEFQGNLSGSITIDNKTVTHILNETPSGHLKFISGSISDVGGFNYMFLVDDLNNPTEITLPLTSPYSEYSYDYSGSLNRILNNDYSVNSYQLLKLTNINDPSLRMEFLISGSSISGSNVTLQVSGTYNSVFNEIYFGDTRENYLNNFELTDWHIGFDFGDNSYVGTFYGDGEFDKLKTHNLYVATEAEVCDGIVTLNTIGTAAQLPKLYEDVNYGQNFAPNVGVLPNSWFENFPKPFHIHLPANGWGDEFHITLPWTINGIDGDDYTAQRGYMKSRRNARWQNKLKQVIENTNREDITLRFGGLYLLGNNGSERGNIRDWFIELKFTNGEIRQHIGGVSNNDITAYTFPVKLVNEKYKTVIAPDGKVYPLYDAFKTYTSQNIQSDILQLAVQRIDSGNNINLNDNFPAFCVQIESIGGCKECGTEETTDGVVRDDTDFNMEFHTNLVLYDPNGNTSLQYNEMTAGSIAIASRERLSTQNGHEFPFLGSFERWPDVNNTDVNFMVIALSDGDANNTIYQDWNNATFNDNTLNPSLFSKNSLNAIDGQMSLLFKNLQEVELLQRYKPAFYGKYNENNEFENKQYTSLLTMRCSHEDHPGSIETFDIQNVTFIDSKIKTDERWSGFVSAGGDTSLALKLKTVVHNSLWMWGRNASPNTKGGKLIPNFENNQYSNEATLNHTRTPFRVSDDKWKYASVGRNHSLAIDSRGRVWAWGDNEYGQLGQQNNYNKYYNELTLVKNSYNEFAIPQIQPNFVGHVLNKTSVGDRHSAILRRVNAESYAEERHVWVCGDNSEGQCGLRSKKGTSVFIPVNPPSGKTWMDVSCGKYSTILLSTDVGTSNMSGGNIWMAGSLDGSEKSTIFTEVGKDLPGSPLFRYISAGPYHNFAIKTDGTLWAWGDNRNGQLGIGNSTNLVTYSLPQQVGNDTWLKVVACGDGYQGFSLGIKTDGTLWAWGYNDYGQLGLGNTTTVYVPTQVGTENGWTDVAGGLRHAIATKSKTTAGLTGGNEIYAWGDNVFGQLGVISNDLNKSLIPIKITDGITQQEHITHAVLSVKWVGGDNQRHMDGPLEDTHKIKVSIKPMYTPYPSYYEIFTAYDLEKDGSYRKWKYKGWEKSIKVICVGGGGGGGVAAYLDSDYIATSAGGGGGGAVAMAEFLASPMRVSGFQDNFPTIYGIPTEADIWVGIGGRSSTTVPTNDEIKNLNAQLEVLLTPLRTQLQTLKQQLIDLENQYKNVDPISADWRDWDKKRKDKDNERKAVLDSDNRITWKAYQKAKWDLQDVIKLLYTNPTDPQLLAEKNRLEALVLDFETNNAIIKRYIELGEEYAIINAAQPGLFSTEWLQYQSQRQTIEANIGSKQNEIENFAKNTSEYAQILQIQRDLNKGGLNGLNGGFSSFGDYLIAAGGDGGKGGIRLWKGVIGLHFLTAPAKANVPQLGLPPTNKLSEKDIKEFLDIMLLTDGGKGGGKEIILKTPQTIKGKHRLYPFKATNTPNSGLSSTYLPGGNGGFGGIFNDDGKQLNAQRRNELINYIQNNPNDFSITTYKLLLTSTYILDMIYDYVLENMDIYSQDGESTFYSTTGGGGGYGLGGVIYGTRYSHEFGESDTKNVAAMLPQSVRSFEKQTKLGEVVWNQINNIFQTNVNGAGFKLGLGGQGMFDAQYTSDQVNNKLALTEYPTSPVYNSSFIPYNLPKQYGGFPGGGGGGGIPTDMEFTVNGDTISWERNKRAGGNGGDGVVIVIGM